MKVKDDDQDGRVLYPDLDLQATVRFFLLCTCLFSLHSYDLKQREVSDFLLPFLRSPPSPSSTPSAVLVFPSMAS